MTYEEAMAVVDAGGIVSHESIWLMREAGFAWGEWIQLRRTWGLGDSLRALDRSLTGDWDAPCIEPSGPYCRTFNTLCEIVFYPSSVVWDAAMADELCDATDWIDVTDQFEDGLPKGYVP